MNSLKKLFVFLFFVLLLNTCAPKKTETVEEQIAFINRAIAEEGHLTKTHLYIHWPGSTPTMPRQNQPGGKEIVPVLTLKIPIEYFPWSFTYFDLNRYIFASDCGEMARYENGCEPGERKGTLDYKTRIFSALDLEKNKIKGFHLGLVTGAKPYTPKTPEDARLTKLSDILLATIRILFNQKSSAKAGDRLKDFDFNLYRRSYVVLIKRDSHFTAPLSLHIKPSVYAIEKSSYFHCIGTSCWVDFGVEGRSVSIWGIGEALDRPRDKNIHQTNFSLPKPQPNVLPKWHEKLDPTQALLNSFVVPEDGTEIKGMFASK